MYKARVQLHLYSKRQAFWFPILDSNRHKFTEAQKQILMKRFQVNPYPERKEKIQLAMSFNTTIKTVQSSFGYMRRKKAAKELLIRSEYCSGSIIMQV